jgi:hypothetical protein
VKSKNANAAAQLGGFDLSNQDARSFASLDIQQTTGALRELCDECAARLNRRIFEKPDCQRAPRRDSRLAARCC